MIRDRIGRRLAKRAVADVVRDPHPPSFGLVQLLLILVALPAVALGPTFVVVGAYIAIAGFPNPVGIILGLIMVGLGWLMRPRRFLPETTPIEAPALTSLLRRLEAAIGSPKVAEIHLDEQFNAFAAKAGWRGRPILGIGLPLFASLEPQERVALLGHELGHFVSLDPIRGRLVGIALRSLWELFTTLEPDYLIHGRMGLQDLVAIPFKLVMLALARLALLYLWVLLAISASESLHAELYADIVGAKLAGRSASISLLEKLHAGEGVARMTWVGETRDPIGSIVDRVLTMPEREHERIRRAERLDLTRTDYLHPATSGRLDVLASLPDAPPLVTLTSEESAAIDGELARYRDRIGARIVDGYLSAIAW